MCSSDLKKLILIAVAFLALQATAQEKRKGDRSNNERGQKMMNLSADEMATLQTKKMTLHLDLNESQQAKIHEINLENAKVRKAYMEKRKANMQARKAKKESGETTEKPSKDERLKMMNKKLDHQIATKQKMKDILNEEQYAKWEKSQAKRTQGDRAKMKEHAKRKGEQRRK